MYITWSHQFDSGEGNEWARKKVIAKNFALISQLYTAFFRMLQPNPPNPPNASVKEMPTATIIIMSLAAVYQLRHC